jgi:hypothetical protein
MKETQVVMMVLFVLILVVIVIIYQSQSIKRRYKAEVTKSLNNNNISEKSILTNNDIKDLPEPIQKYLIYVGAVGKEKVRNMRITFRGQMKMDLKKDWIEINAEQYNFYDKLTRLFYINGKMYGVPIVGMDSFINGKGNMHIKAASLITVADVKGKEMDMAAMVTLFDDMCLMSPATLNDKRIHWESINPLTVKGVFEDGGNKVSALLYFNTSGELINFVTDDRYYAPIGKSPENVRWSTPVKDYKEINGVRVPTYGEAIWHLPEGDFCYAKFDINDVEYNCVNFK